MPGIDFSVFGKSKRHIPPRQLLPKNQLTIQTGLIDGAYAAKPYPGSGPDPKIQEPPKADHVANTDAGTI